MATEQQDPRRRWAARLALGVLCLVVVMPLVLPGSSPVEARRYGRKYNYGEIIARCKGSCARKSGAMKACIARTRRKQVKNCKAVLAGNLAECSDASCKTEAREAMRACVKSAGTGSRYYRRGANAGGCNRCCQRSRGQGDCQGYFSGPFYDSSRYRGRLSCPGDSGGGGGGGGGKPKPPSREAQ